MKKKATCWIMLAFLLTGIFLFAFDIQLVKSELGTWIVDDDGPADFHTIQEAINSPDVKVGDTIFVKAGTYYEHVIVNKTVSLIGEGANVTAINGNLTGRTVVINADNVTISNFRIENGGLLWYPFEDCNVFINGSDTKILNNEITGPVLALVESSSFGNKIEHNNLIGAHRGILLGGSFNNTIAQNYIEAGGLVNVAAGSNNTIVDNYIKNTGGGWSLVIGDMNKVFNNTIVCVARWDYGYSGISVGGFNNITGNTIIVGALGSFSVCGIKVGSSNNIIYHNNFFNYTQPVLMDEPVNNTWDNGYPSGGNYWSGYKGTDLHSGPYQNETGRDRIGDTEYIFDENNRDNYPLIYPYPCLTMPWDITGLTPWTPDGTCDIMDVTAIAKLFGSVKGDRRYDRRADITGSIYLLPDGGIDIKDIAAVARHFGETYP